MPEPFKNLFNVPVINGMAHHFAKAWNGFDEAGFNAMATDNLEALELKQRSTQITKALRAFMPRDFEKTANIMLKSLAPEEGYDISTNHSDAGIVGWAIMPMVDYVGLYGLDNFDVSMNLFKQLTKRSSSEFGIRYFIIEKPKETLDVLKTWLENPNQHVRRLISEGTRPRLPWGMQLTEFVKDPTPVIELLEALKDDDEEYVRRSVANNLNDIAKDHPDLVTKIAKDWLKNADKNRERLVKHACRTLIKQGHKACLEALGYGEPAVLLEKLEVKTPQVEFGKALMFEISLSSTSQQEQNLIIDFAIHHRKANGKTAPKVFKWKNIKLKAGESLNAQKAHPMRKITTRTYYSGAHHLEIFVNGVSLCLADFELNI